MEPVTSAYGYVAEFFNHPLFAIFGGIGSVLVILGFAYKAISIFFGVMPIAIRLGYGLWKRKIAVISDADRYSKLAHSLKSSNLFAEKKHSARASEHTRKLVKCKFIFGRLGNSRTHS